MANLEQLNILKQGNQAWNEWRENNPEIKPNLKKALLWKIRRNYDGVNFSGVNFELADLPELSLIDANFSNSNLHRSCLYGAKLMKSNLHGVDLSGAELTDANLTGSNLANADLYHAVLGATNLSNVNGLEDCIHRGPTIIDHRTLTLSGMLPVRFLRGCGLAEEYIEYLPSLIGSAIEFYSCFISYSSSDQKFAERLHADLQDKGVRCWFAPEDLKIGDKIRNEIDHAIRVRDKLLIVLSENSIKSQWVEKEVETAFEEERNRTENVLFPIRLDDTVMETDATWAADIRRTRHIGDFKNWKEHESYEKAFQRLMRDFKNIN